jgi:hypothetical protein
MAVSLPGPDALPPGPHRDLVEALHTLYQGAGTPGLRPIAKAVMEGDFRDTVSHEKVAAMLRGNGLPRWSKLEPVVRILATWHAPRLDADKQVVVFQRLWHAAQNDTAGVPALGPDTAPVPRVAPVPRSATASNAEPDGACDARDLVQEVGTELAARAHADRRADTDRGYRDGVAFARDLPSPDTLDELARCEFDVAAWIRPWHDQWSRIAARLDPHNTQVPDWAWKAARYLGTRADPIGFDQFSFTTTEAYLTGFGTGLKAVWHAMREQEPVEPDPADDPPPHAPSQRIASDLARLLRGHAGLSLNEVEHAGQVLLEQLHERFQHAPVRDRLPTGARLAVDWFQATNCTYWDRPYRMLNWHHHGLKLILTLDEPGPVRAECTPMPGISRSREADHALIAIDANRPHAHPLLLPITAVHPRLSQDGAKAINAWVEQCLTTLLTDFSQSLAGALTRLGYDA